MEKLLPEIVLDIFYRLPPESVVVCKFVCKSWHSLIRLFLRGHFANMDLIRHHRYHQGNLESPTLNFILLHEFRDEMAGLIKNVYGEFHITEYDQVEEQLNCKVRKIDFPQICIAGWKCKTRLDGSCNGLICLTIVYHHINLFRQISICNPLMNEYVRLPQSDLQLKYGDMETMVIGFGQSLISEEYKVVGVCYPHLESGIGHVEVITLCNNISSNDAGMWRSKGTIKYRLRKSSQPVLINGSLYWLAKYGMSHEQNIVSFDLEDEEFRAIPLTSYPDNNFVIMSNRELKELRGCLCLIEKLSDQMDIWVLKDFMNKESWVKEFSIKWEIIKWEGLPLLYSPCAIKRKKNGDGDEILLWYNSRRLVSYDLKTGNVEVVGERQMLINTESINDWDPVLHISSLVTLKGSWRRHKIMRRFIENLKQKLGKVSEDGDGRRKIRWCYLMGLSVTQVVKLCSTQIRVGN